MLKLVGFLIGAAITAALLTGRLPLPRLDDARTMAAEGTRNASEKVSALAEKYRSVEGTEREADGSSGTIAKEVAPKTTSDGTPADFAPAVAATSQRLPKPEPVPIGTAPLPDPAPNPRDGVHTRHYAFWAPFHSEASAEGFSRRLAALTGGWYSVTKVDIDNYQVAFAYRDEEERLALLQAIEVHTGIRPIGTPP